MKRTCKECGRPFELSEGEVGFYESKGFELPKRCHECRERNKNRNYEDEYVYKKKSGTTLSKSNKNMINIILIIAVLVFVLVTGNGFGGNTSADYHFKNDELLTEHFEKHGGEFQYNSKEEYELGANEVINSEDALQKEEAEDGDEIYYLEKTNEIVFLSKDGYIRSYFKPSDGVEYFNRQ